MNERGFTLMEALVLILIVGILAAIALPALIHPPARHHQSCVRDY